MNARKQISAFARAAAAAPASALWALDYVDAGLHPIRVKPPRGGVQGTGKAPVGGGWQTRPLDVEALCSELASAPRSNLGLRMGRQSNGTAVIALDEDAAGALDALAGRLGPLPRTMTTRTGKGRHMFYAVPPSALARLRNFVKREGVDLRTEGGHVCAAPSIHYSGARYRTTLRPVAELPEAWLEWLTQGEPRADRKSADVRAAHGRALDLSMLADAPTLATTGSRHKTAWCIGAWAGSKGFSDEAIEDALREHFPTDDPDARVKDALDGASVGREGGTTGWGELGELLNEDVRAALEDANPQPPDPVLTAWSERRARNAAANDTSYNSGNDAAVDDVINALASPELNVYQRAGMLCTITREAKVTEREVRPAGAPTIRPLAPPRLREIIRTRCGHKLESHAPEVAARGEWHAIRPLDAVASYPIMRRDGSLLLGSGYDAATHTLAEINVSVSVPSKPTQADAKRALAMLTDVVCDFPFASEAARAAWLAMLLTVPARPAIDGPTPLGLIEASQRGSGKTLLADLIALITTGVAVPRRVAPKSKEEWDKSMLATLVAGDPLVLIDNVTTMLVSDALDAVLTGTTYSGRWLGVSENRTVAVRTVFLASSNNARLSTDLVRRSIACRLSPAVERPEARDGFKHPEIERYVVDRRADLLGAVLTILRAYAVAGRPEVKAQRMGSYTAWCRVVRDALVWLGAADPAETQAQLRENADVEGDEVRDLINAWHALLGEKTVTVRALLDSADSGGEKAEALRDALRAIMPNGVEPTAHAIGIKLRTLREQVVGGRWLLPCTPDKHAKTAAWRVARSR